MKHTISLCLLLAITGCQLPYRVKLIKCESPAPAEEYCTCTETCVTDTINMPVTQNEFVLPPAAVEWTPPESDTRLENLESELRRLEQQRSAELSRESQLQASLNSVNARMGQLTAEVDHWKNQVERIERESLEQHSMDLESLNQLSALVEQIPVATEE